MYCRRGYVQTRIKIWHGYYQHPQHLVEQLLQKVERDFKARNQKLNVNGTLVQPVNFLLDLRYNVHSQLTETNIKHKSGSPVQTDKKGKEHASVTLRLAPFPTEILGFKFFFTTSVFTLQIKFLMWIRVYHLPLL